MKIIEFHEIQKGDTIRVHRDLGEVREVLNDKIIASGHDGPGGWHESWLSHPNVKIELVDRPVNLPVTPGSVVRLVPKGSTLAKNRGYWMLLLDGAWQSAIGVRMSPDGLLGYARGLFDIETLVEA